jgi:hypothetical protein
MAKIFSVEQYHFLASKIIMRYKSAVLESELV